MDLVNHLNDRLLFAVPKKGRLYEKVVAILKNCDISFRRSDRLDIALSTNMPIALIFLRAADIPTFVGMGKCDLGITGVDEVQESNQENVQLSLDLNFGKCKLQIQVPEKGEYKKPEQLIGKTIVTSFVHLSSQYFAKLENTTVDKMTTKILYAGGSVEASCALGVADGIVDLVESGETMRACGLTDIATILDTSAHLIESKTPQSNNLELIETIKSRINGVLTAQKYVSCYYNAPKENLDKLLVITPGRRAPTISDIGEEGWVAVSSMIERSQKGFIMDELKKNGASDIMVFEISNCRV
ncbi:ATP phosphoribosyltransferase (ATP-PRTase) (ATP-PRT) [Hanseniaspora osmophila]|uniref:ATP phosphoribosyltransferase n=1 Tax=Hanseniaspora osmophila TaxID=56408 RepID=A0A1E5RAN2_9ASCO|nr:ATP phosphoribosyltransferase [Hanseniaspora osmophila]